MKSYRDIPSGSVRRVADDTRAWLQGKTVGVLVGGKSQERIGSFQTGEFIARQLSALGIDYELIDPASAAFVNQIYGVDLILNALHGQYGEDGKVQGLLDVIGKPYAGCGVLASAIGMDKVAFKLFLKLHNLLTPDFTILSGTTEDAGDFGFPLFLKPRSEGGSIDMELIKNQKDLHKRLGVIGEELSYYFLEKYIHGRITTVPVLEIDKEAYALPVVEVHLSGGKSYYDKQAKYEGGFTYYSIPNLSESVFEEMFGAVTAIWNNLGCRGCGRIDFIIEEKTNKPYILEINTLPGIYSGSNFEKAASEVGISNTDLVLLLSANAVSRPGYLP